MSGRRSIQSIFLLIFLGVCFCFSVKKKKLYILNTIRNKNFFGRAVSAGIFLNSSTCPWKKRYFFASIWSIEWTWWWRSVVWPEGDQWFQDWKREHLIQVKFLYNYESVYYSQVKLENFTNSSPTFPTSKKSKFVFDIKIFFFFWEIPHCFVFFFFIRHFFLFKN